MAFSELNAMNFGTHAMFTFAYPTRCSATCAILNSPMRLFRRLVTLREQFWVFDALQTGKPYK